ncbi:response regulator [bacterium]|nr:response regulator [bacterium]
MRTVTLLIDTRKELSTKYKKILKTETNICYTAKNLISAMKYIHDYEPDLILISDSVDGDLADYCKKIRALTYDTRPIIIALSKSAEISDKLKALENGADDFISEPIMNEEFLMRVHVHLRREFESNLNEKKLLPNRKYSMRAIKRTISAKKHASAFLISIDNFENYAKNYTTLASDKLLQTYIAIIKATVDQSDYLGEIKDNEFLLISENIDAEAVANYFTYAFETVASKFYSIEDNRRGYLIVNGDDLAGRRVNFVHTTIGVITDTTGYSETTQLYNALLQIHKTARMSAKSNYLVVRPQIAGEISSDIKQNNKIVICEKDDALKTLLKTILELQGYETVVADEPSEIENVPALWILDVGDVEDRVGLKYCESIKADPRYSSSKVILTSVLHDKETVLNSGADVYLPKPYEISSLIKWVEELLNS